MPRIVPANVLRIPDSAKCVFKGVIYDVYQWNQKMFDGSVAVFEMLRRPDTVQVVCIDEGQVIYVSDTQPNRHRISFPGGRVEKDEDWLDAAKREILEETGYKFKNWKLVFAYQPVTKIDWLMAWFVAWDVEERLPSSNEVGEKIELRYATLDEALKIIDLEDRKLGLRKLPEPIANAKSIDELIGLPEFKG